MKTAAQILTELTDLTIHEIAEFGSRDVEILSKWQADTWAAATKAQREADLELGESRLDWNVAQRSEAIGDSPLVQMPAPEGK